MRKINSGGLSAMTIKQKSSIFLVNFSRITLEASFLKCVCMCVEVKLTDLRLIKRQRSQKVNF